MELFNIPSEIFDKEEWFHLSTNSEGNTTVFSCKDLNIKENEMPSDQTILDSLDRMRDARDASVRLRDTLIDEAQLAELRAQNLRAQANFMTEEINEDVPVPPGE